jgi:hypothetical protein
MAGDLIQIGRSGRFGRLLTNGIDLGWNRWLQEATSVADWQDFIAPSAIGITSYSL